MLFVGAPGVGKGTYASRLAPMMDVEHLAAGDLVRDEISKGSELGLSIQDTVRTGGLVDDETMMNMIQAQLSGRGLLEPGSKGFILDGVPRTLGQAQAIDRGLKLDLVLHMTMDPEIIVLKMSARRLDKDGNVFNIAYLKQGEMNMPPLLPCEMVERDGKLYTEFGTEIVPNTHVACARALEGLTQRDDDTAEVIQDRMRVYEESTLPVVEHYRQQGLVIDFAVEGGTKQVMPGLLKALGVDA